jgi:hypothetical protein
LGRGESKKLFLPTLRKGSFCVGSVKGGTSPGGIGGLVGGLINFFFKNKIKNHFGAPIPIFFFGPPPLVVKKFLPPFYNPPFLKGGGQKKGFNPFFKPSGLVKIKGGAPQKFF